MKILTDFDGVLTDLTHEAHRVYSLFRENLCLRSIDKDQVLASLSSIENEMRTSPHKFGWLIQDRITAYCDEDPFIFTNALAAYLNELAKNNKEPWASINHDLMIQNGHGYIELAHYCFKKMASETHACVRHPVDPNAIEFMRETLKSGVSWVIVSNSSTLRIHEILKNENLPITEHETDANAQLRIRGSANKFLLGESKGTMSIEGREIDLNRPNYLSILIEEKPDWVIGDVFSFDLALPISLKAKNQKGFESLIVWMRQRTYSPNWALEFLARSHIKGVTGGVFQGFNELKLNC